MEATDQSQAVTRAIAEAFECKPEEITSYALVCERMTEEGLTCSWIWSSTPIWGILGLAQWLVLKVKAASNGEI